MEAAGDHVVQARAGDGVATGRRPAAGCWARRREAAMYDRLWRSQLRRRPKHGTAPQRAREASRTLLAAPVTGFAFLMPLHLAQPAQSSSPPPPRQVAPPSLYLFNGPLLSSSLCVAGVGSFRPVSLCTSLAFLHCGSASRTSSLVSPRQEFSHRCLRRPITTRRAGARIVPAAAPSSPPAFQRVAVALCCCARLRAQGGARQGGGPAARGASPTHRPPEPSRTCRPSCSALVPRLHPRM